MASGLPVLAAPVGGIEDYLRDDENGFHIRHDSLEIASKLDALLSDRSLHERISKAGIATATDYAWEKIANQYLDLFCELRKEETGESNWVGQEILGSETSVSVQS
jgi:glycosyltransferase involved in cell wall biosynthesis